VVRGAEGTLMARLETFRVKRLNMYDNLFSANVLCITGLLVMPALLFNPSTVMRVIQFLFFLFLAWLSGKKINPFVTAAIIICITFFNLLIPYGRVLLTIGSFKITETALLTGIRRAVTLEGLIMLSKVCIRHDLKFPGTFGELLGESLRISSVLMSRKYNIRLKTIFTDLDNLMTDLSNESASISHNVQSHTKLAAYVIIGIVILISWLLLVWKNVI
jgi:heptaprenyl diphosphate synthase